ncbi:MAG: hypothetical protein K0S79_853 [Nitrospira sp.]|jgi:hypothetical protein|nr:hypothetical protein [Nitrospira sp.]
MFEGLTGSLLSLVILGAVMLGFSTFVVMLLMWIFGRQDDVEASAAYEPSVKMRLPRAA